MSIWRWLSFTSRWAVDGSNSELCKARTISSWLRLAETNGPINFRLVRYSKLSRLDELPS